MCALLFADLFGKGEGDGINQRSIAAVGLLGAFSCTVVKQVLPSSMRASQFAACYFGGIYVVSWLYLIPSSHL